MRFWCGDGRHGGIGSRRSNTGIYCVVSVRLHINVYFKYFLKVVI